jgi:phage terminase large subunit GpA-like protein
MGSRDLPDDYARAAALVSALFAEFMRPPANLTVSQWADKNRMLSGKASSEPGPWRTDRTPYLRQIMDDLSARSTVQEVVVMFAAQLGKSETGNNWLGYIIDNEPGPVMIVQPTTDMAKRFSRQRITPMLEETPVLRRKVRENRSRDDANTTLMKDFAGGVLVVSGANSAAGLRSMPVRYLFLDEIDAYPLDVDGEGDPVALAEKRTSTFARKKVLKVSTPTTKDFSRIEAAYNQSNANTFMVACPHCGQHQALVWGTTTPHGLRWNKAPDGTPELGTVRYVCQHNGCEIQEHHKPAMLATGYWKASRDSTRMGRLTGYHLNALYAPLGWVSWADLVQQFTEANLAAKNGDISKLKTFVNTVLAETWEEQGDRTNIHDLLKRAPDIPLRQVHWGLFVCTMGVDTQGDRLEAYVWAWGRGMERQLVDRQIIYGDPGLPEGEPGSPWTALTEYRRAPIQHVSGRTVLPRVVMIDSGGHHTQAVYEYARRHQHMHVYAIKGMSVAGKSILGKPSDQDVNWRGQKLKRGVKLWPIGTDTAKAEIYGRLRNTEPGPGYVHISKHHHPEVFEQLTSERLVTRYVKGHARMDWVKPAGKRNEALDCAVYALAGAHFLGMERWREAEWSKMESEAQGRDLFDAPLTPPPEKQDKTDPSPHEIIASSYQSNSETKPQPQSITTNRPARNRTSPRLSW